MGRLTGGGGARPRRLRIRWPGVALLAVILVTPVVLSAVPEEPRIVAVGDVHGDLEAFTAILRQAGLIDAGGRWVGGRSRLVQTGDLLDRGPAPRAVMDLLIDLEKQAARQGGEVHVLLGNHEVMNLVGDLRYVTAGNFAEYADARSEARREAAWTDYLKVQEGRARRRGEPFPAPVAAQKAAWVDAHPLGFVEHRDAFGPRGTYGRWLREHAAVLALGDTVFVHGGVSDTLPVSSLTELEHRVRGEIESFDSAWRILAERGIIPAAATLAEARALAADEAAALSASSDRGAPADADPDLTEALRTIDGIDAGFAMSSEGPLWFRGYANWEEADGKLRVQAVQSRLGAARLVVGHTVTEGCRIVSRFDGAAILIDTGMLATHFEGGRASALEIDSKGLTAIYMDGRAPVAPPPALAAAAAAQAGPAPAPLPPAPAPAPAPAAAPRRWRGPDGQPLPFDSDDAVLEFLRTATIVSLEDLGEGTTHPKKVLLERDGVRAHAIFRDVDVERQVTQVVGKGRETFFRDSYILECAAYQLSRILGLDSVPPVVPRSIEGKPGSLQIWLEAGMTENKRRERKIDPPDVVAYGRQMQTIHLFDALVYNTDRNLGNYLIDPEWKIWMIDHTRAFRRQQTLQEPVEFNRCDRALLARLRALDVEATRRQLAPFLRNFEIEALVKRRVKLLQFIDKLLELQGEASTLFDYLEPVEAEP